MQDNAATVLTLQALREIGGELRAIRDELHRLNDVLEGTRVAPQAPSPEPLAKYPRMAPR